MSKPVTQDNKCVAEYAARAFGGDYHVREYLHDTEPLAVDVLRCDDRPQKGVTSYSTIGLSDNPTRSVGGHLPTRMEIAGACVTAVDYFANVLASAAFHVVRTGEPYHLAAVMLNYVSQYDESMHLPHLYFTAPFPWTMLLETVECPTKKVSWLMAVPISESEYRYVKQNGHHALDELMRISQTDIFAISRPSLV